MSNVGNTISAKRQYKGKLTLKLVFVILPFVLAPILIVGALFLLPVDTTNLDIITIIAIIAVLTVLLSTLFLSGFIHSQVIKPIKAITQVTDEISSGSVDKKLVIKRRDEIGELMEKVNQIGEKFNTSLLSREPKALAPPTQIQTCADISRYSVEADSLEDLLQSAVKSLSDEFDHDHIAFYLRSKSGRDLSIQACTGETDTANNLRGYSVNMNEVSIVGWTASHKEIHVAADVSEDQLYKSVPGLDETKSELAIPIQVENELIGVLDLQDQNLDAFSLGEITLLKTIIDLIAVSLHNFDTLSTARFDPKISAYLFNASYQISLADNSRLIYQSLSNALKRLPFLSSLYLADGNKWHCALFTDKNGVFTRESAGPSLSIDTNDIATNIPRNYPVDFSKQGGQLENLTGQMAEFTQELGYKNLILYPLFIETRLQGLLLLGTADEEPINRNLLNAVTKLVDITKISLINLNRYQSFHNQLDLLKILNAIGQFLSNKASLNQLLGVIHQQINEVIGKIDFQVALYSKTANTIEIPYRSEGEEIRSIPPFPLNHGLLSKLIQTQKPIKISENFPERSHELGAIIDNGEPAQSWLGVPILAGDEILGAVVIQDPNRENRFKEEDVSFLSMIASQIGIALDNTRLFVEAKRFTEHEQTVSNFASKLSQSMDIDNILKMAVLQLGQLPNVQDAAIHIKPPKS